MSCHCVEGWICEEHSELGWPHDECAGPGMPCENKNCPWWKWPNPAALPRPNWEAIINGDVPTRKPS